jgi:hypothetical protein
MCSKRIFAHAKRLLVGAMRAPGKRPGTAVVRVLGSSHAQHVQHDPRGLNRARGSTPRGGRLRLQGLVRAFAPTGPLGIGSAATIARRRGARMTANGIDRDPVRSSPAPFVPARGVRWGCLRRLAPVPWSTRVWGVPCLTGRSPSERDSQPRGRSPRTLLDRARHAVWLGRRWLPARALVVVGDRTEAALEWREAVRHAAGVSPRVRREAALDEPAPPRQLRQNGRPRQQGKRWPTRAHVLPASTTRWRTVPVASGDGAGAQRVQIPSQTAVWSHSGTPVVPRRWGLMRAPAGRFEPQALLATDQRRAPDQILTDVVRRWQRDTTGEAVRTHLGVETQRPWSAQATARTTPAVLARSAMITLMAAHMLGTHTLPVRPAAWYRQEWATCSDTIAVVRPGVWRQGDVSTSKAEAAVVNIPRALFERLTDALCYAASMDKVELRCLVPQCDGMD